VPALAPTAPPPDTLDELLEAFERHLRLERGMAANTVAAYLSDLGRFAGWLDAERLAPLKLTGEQANAYVDQLAAHGLGPASVRRHTASLRALYRWLLLDERLRIDPTAKLRSPGRGRVLPRSLRQIEVARLLAAPEGDSPRALRDRAILELFYACGLRISEVAQLALGDVDLSAGVRVRGKGDKERLVPIGRGAPAALQAYLRKGRPRLAKGSGDRALFLSRHRRGMTRQGIYLIVREHARTAGLEGRMTPHTLRHTFATHLLQGGCDVRALAEMLGHASIDTTQGYTHLAIEDVKEAFYRAHPRARIEREARP
jgi:integrase/recombinase XerD